MNEGTLKEYAKLFRLPSSLGISIIGVIGALSVKGEDLTFLPLVILLTMGIFGNIFGYVLNDYMDAKYDKHSKELSERPLVRGTISKKAAMGVIISCLAIIFVLPSIFFRNILLFFILIISIILGIFYDLFCKKIVCSEFFLGGAMASFCLFGAVAVSGDIRNLNELGGLTWVIVALMFFYVFIMDTFEGNLKDVERDRKAGAITLPVYLGVKTSDEMEVPLCYKALLVFFKVIIVILIFIPFILLDYSFWNWQLFILVMISFGMIWALIKVLNERSFNKEKISIYARRHGVISYFIFPFILIRFIGFEWAIFLIFFPVIWPLLLNRVLYGKSLAPAAYTK